MQVHSNVQMCTSSPARASLANSLRSLARVLFLGPMELELSRCPRLVVVLPELVARSSSSRSP